MALLTKGIIRSLEKHPFRSQMELGDNAKVLVKFFGGSSFTFLVTEGQQMENGDWEFFGKGTTGFGWEWGYMWLSQLMAMRFPPYNTPVERELYLTPGMWVCEEAT